MAQYERGLFDLSDDVGRCEGLPRACHPEERLEGDTLLEATDELADRLGLVARRLEARGELKVHTLLALMDSELWEGEGNASLVEVLVHATIEVPEDRP